LCILWNPVLSLPFAKERGAGAGAEAEAEVKVKAGVKQKKENH